MRSVVFNGYNGSQWPFGVFFVGFSHGAQRLGAPEVPYQAPDFLCSALHDWLNLHMDLTSPKEGGYRFCYVGVKGTGTKLHHDVLFSHSWSAAFERDSVPFGCFRSGVH